MLAILLAKPSQASVITPDGCYSKVIVVERGNVNYIKIIDSGNCDFFKVGDKFKLNNPLPIKKKDIRIKREFEIKVSRGNAMGPMGVVGWIDWTLKGSDTTFSTSDEVEKF